MKPELEQEIWRIFNVFPGLRLGKMTVGYIGKERFICHEQVAWVDCTNYYDEYGTSWFLTEKEALEWLKRNGYEWSDYIYAYVKKGEEEQERADLQEERK